MAPRGSGPAAIGARRMDYAPDDDAVDQFVAMTQCDAEHARFLLEAAGGNVDLALQMYFGERGPGGGAWPGRRDMGGLGVQRVLFEWDGCVARAPGSR